MSSESGDLRIVMPVGKRPRSERRLGRGNREGALQVEFEVGGVGDGVEAVRSGRFEAEGFVERLGGLHGGESVEKHAAVAKVFCFGDQRQGELATDAEVAAGGADVEALHFAFDFGEAAEGAAGEEFVVLAGEEKCAAWRTIFLFEMEEFFVEILEVEADVEGGGVFADQRSRGFPERRRIGMDELSHW
jgi:hypothetical protein